MCTLCGYACLAQVNFTCVCVCSCLSCSPLSYASVLLELLSSFREPVLPTLFFPAEEFKAVTVASWCSSTLLRLSPMHFNTLLFMIAFIKELVRHSAQNGLTEEIAARVFSRVLLRKAPHEEAALHGSFACILLCAFKLHGFLCACACF